MTRSSRTSLTGLLAAALLCAPSSARAGGFGNGGLWGAVVGGVSSVLNGGGFSEGARAGAQAAASTPGLDGDTKAAAQAGKAAAQQSSSSAGPTNPFSGHGGEDHNPAANPNPAGPVQSAVQQAAQQAQLTAAQASAMAAAANANLPTLPPDVTNPPPPPPDHHGTTTPPDAVEGEEGPAKPPLPSEYYLEDEGRRGPTHLGSTGRPAAPSPLASLDTPKRYQVDVPELPPGREYKGGAATAAEMSAHQKLGMDVVASANGVNVNVGALAPPSAGHPAGARRLASGALIDGRDGERALRATLSSGESRFGLKDYKGALAEAEAAIAMAPGRADGYLLYAKVLNRMGLHAKAEEMARKAKSLAADLGAATRAQAELTQAYLFQGRTADALASAAEAIGLAQKAGSRGLEANALYLQAAACQLKGDRDCMIRSLERAAFLDGKYYAALDAARAGRSIFDPKDTESLGLLDAVGTDAVPVPGGLGTVGAVLLGAFALLAGAAAWAWRRSRAKPAQPTIAEAFGRKDDGLLGGKYELGRSVPSGGRGEMWEARDHSLGRPCHVLRLPSPEAAARARLLARAHHPAVLDVFEVLDTPRGTYLVVEQLRGRTLRQVLAARGKLGLDEARRLLKPVCEALEFARGQGVVDGSLDLSQVMMTDDGYVKVLDLAAARPESAGRTDVQALAGCLEELLTGEPPRPGGAALRGPVGDLLREAAGGGVPGPAAFAARLERVDQAVPAG